jgi:hypothetical protein
MTPDRATLHELLSKGPELSPPRRESRGRFRSAPHGVDGIGDGAGSQRGLRPRVGSIYRPTHVGHGAAGANPDATGAGAAGTATPPTGAPQQGGALLTTADLWQQLHPAETRIVASTAAIMSCRFNMIAFLHRNSAAAGVSHRRQESGAGHRNASALPLGGRLTRGSGSSSPVRHQASVHSAGDQRGAAPAPGCDGRTGRASLLR